MLTETGEMDQLQPDGFMHEETIKQADYINKLANCEAAAETRGGALARVQSASYAPHETTSHHCHTVWSKVPPS